MGAEDTLAGCTAASTAVVRTLAPRPPRMREAASGLLLATEVADYLVARGVPFRTAHEVTGRIVRDLYSGGRDFSAALKEVRPTTQAWFDTAKNYALYANEGGLYDDLLTYLKRR